MKLVRPAIIAVAVVAAFVLGYFAHPLYQNYKNNQVVKPAKDFVSDLTAGKTSQAYAETSASFKSKQTEDVFTKVIGNVKSDKAAYSGETIAINKNAAVYTVAVTNLPPDALGSTNAVFVLGLAQQDGKWAVDSVNIQ